MFIQLALAATLVAVLGLARRWHIDLVSPAVLFATIWLVGLLGATFPPFGIDDWSPNVWLVMVAAPAFVVAGAALAAGSRPVFREPIGFRRIGGATERTAWLLLAGTIIGGAVFVFEFAVVGGIPLISGKADQLRFHLVVNPFLHLLTRLVPVSVVLALILVPRVLGRTRWVLSAVVVLGASLLALQASRLEVVTVVGIYGLTALMVYRLSRRVLMGLSALAIVTLAFASSVFLLRLPQNPTTAFEFAMLDQVVPSRGPLLAWTVPAQIGISSGMWVMGRLVLTDALVAAPGSGLYMLHGYDRFLPAKDSQAVAVTVTSPLIAPTYLADPYGDFGLAGATAFSLGLGLIAGGAYRMAVRRGSLFFVVLYAYVMYWVLFGIYVNIWTYYAFWIVDIVLIWVGCRIINGNRVAVPIEADVRSANVNT
jgi:hypothetical protein